MCTVSSICLHSGENTKAWVKMGRYRPNTPQSCHPPSMILWGNRDYFSQQHSPSDLGRGDAVRCDPHLQELQVSLPGSRFRRLVAGLSQRRSGFEPMPVYVRFTADKVLQFSPISTIPPMLHTHSFTYHSPYIIFLSQYFNFPLSLPNHQCSTPIHSPTTHAI